VRDGPDSLPYLAARLDINNYASEPVDMYALGFTVARQFVRLGSTARVLDIGCNNAVPLVNAARQKRVRARLFGLDIAIEPYGQLTPAERQASNLTLIQGDAAALPFGNEVFDLASAHSSLYRPDDPVGVLKEMHRVLRPGGVGIVGTNFRDNGDWRHWFERKVDERIYKEFKIPAELPNRPAHRSFAERFPRLAAAVKGFRIVHFLSQNTKARITADRLRMLQYAMETNVTRLPEPYSHDPNVRRRYRELVAQDIMPLVSALTEMRDGAEEPCFVDTIHRALFWLLKEKA